MVGWRDGRNILLTEPVTLGGAVQKPTRRCKYIMFLFFYYSIENYNYSTNNVDNMRSQYFAKRKINTHLQQKLF